MRVDKKKKEYVFTLRKEKAATDVVSARYSVWAYDPKEAVEIVLIDKDLSLKSGALMIDITCIFEVPECSLLKKNEKGEFVCGKLGHMCKLERHEHSGSCILYIKDENKICVPAGIISFSNETIEVKREIFNFIRTNGP